MLWQVEKYFLWPQNLLDYRILDSNNFPSEIWIFIFPYHSALLIMFHSHFCIGDLLLFFCSRTKMIKNRELESINVFPMCLFLQVWCRFWTLCLQVQYVLRHDSIWGDFMGNTYLEQMCPSFVVIVGSLYFAGRDPLVYLFKVQL